MKDMQIEHIIEKYFAGETSLQEEEWLKTQMRRDDLPLDLKQYQPLFHFYQQQAAIQRPKPQKEADWTKLTRKRLWVWLGSAVAAIALIFLLVKNIDPNPGYKSASGFTYEDTYETPEEAYEQTQKILSFLSSKLKSGDKHKAKIARIQTLTSLVEAKKE